MRALLAGLDTVECAYYLRPGPDCSLDFEVLRAQKEVVRQAGRQEEGVVQLGGIEFLLSPNGTRSGYPFLISNQHCAIQFGEFNNPAFYVTYRQLRSMDTRSGAAPSRVHGVGSITGLSARAR